MAGICRYLFIVLIVLISAEGICHNETFNTKANKFLISKWRLWYKSLDVNHDGKVSMEDAKECENNYFVMEHLDDKQGKTVKKALEKWWDECVFRIRKGDILEQEFVNALRTDFNADEKVFKKEMDMCFDLVFSATDFNEDKSISKNELLINMVAYGHPHMATDDEYFSAFNPTNGLVPYRDIVDSWIDFITSTDKSKGNIIQMLFKIDGFE